MSIVDKFVFPRPNSKITLNTEKNLIYVPVFKDTNSYKILKEYLKDQHDFYKTKTNNPKNSYKMTEQPYTQSLILSQINLEKSQLQIFLKKKTTEFGRSQTFSQITEESKLKMSKIQNEQQINKNKTEILNENGINKLENDLNIPRLLKPYSQFSENKNNICLAEKYINDILGSCNNTFDFEVKRLAPSTVLCDKKQSPWLSKKSCLQSQTEPHLQINSNQLSHSILLSKLQNYSKNKDESIAEKTDFRSNSVLN